MVSNTSKRHAAGYETLQALVLQGEGKVYQTVMTKTDIPIHAQLRGLKNT